MTNYLERIYRDVFVALRSPDPDQLALRALQASRAELLGDATLGPTTVRPSGESQRMYEQDYVNDTSVEQSQTFNYHQERQRSVTVTRVRTLEACQELAVQVDLSGFGSFSGKVGFREGASTTASETVNALEDWGVDNAVRIPPHKKVTAVLYVDEGELSVDYEAQAHLWLQTGPETYEIGALVSHLDLSTARKRAQYGFDVGEASAMDSPRYRLDGDRLVGRASGTLSARAGARVRTVSTEHDGSEQHELQNDVDLPRALKVRRAVHALAAALA
ncbi:ETX/MTX2 family pore-forming toxin [Streptomyces griseoviridis]|uniref:ETX/MTX2 family pore-forming toxin n=1 Tax=Streptomyces griseoviridis TaxID=45398 RepID=UPI00344B7A93